MPSVGTRRGSIAVTVGLILSAVFAVEGGYVNHPNDPGGATNHGVTERVARESGYRGDLRDLRRYCLDQNDVCAEGILRQNYVDRPGFLPLVEIDAAVATEVIDTGVNMGPAHASRFFQQAVNDTCGASLTVDGVIGPRSVSAWRLCRSRSTCREMLTRLDALQARRYRRIIRANPRMRVFERGWMNHRIGNVDPRTCA